MRRLPLLVALLALGACDAAGRADAEATRGLSLARAGKLQESVAAFDRAVEIDPGNLKAQYNSALALEQLGRKAEAIERMAAFTRLRPADAPGWFELARMHAGMAEQDQALAALKHAVDAGFADYAKLTTGGPFRALYPDIRYVALESVVAQRAGAEPDAGFLEGVDRQAAYGGTALRKLEVPGLIRDGECPGKAQGKSCGE
jgi:tetratricopeptide (TPR) repeat protein